MAITPTVLIAASGMMNGSGIGTSPDMTASISSVNTNPLASVLASLNASSGSVAGLPATLATLPAFLTTSSNLAANVNTQANLITSSNITSSSDPAIGIKTFVGLHGSATGGASAFAEFASALQNFGSKSFADMGVHAGSFADVITQGVSAISPSINRLASLASQLPLGSLGQFGGGLSALSSATSALAGVNSLATKLGSLVPSGASISKVTDRVPSFQNPGSQLGLSGGLGSVAQLTASAGSAVPGLSGSLGQDRTLLNSAVPTIPSSIGGTGATLNSSIPGLVSGVGGSMGQLSSSLNSGLPSVGAGLGSSMGGVASMFGSMGQNLNPTALAKGQAVLTSQSLNAGLQDVGTGLQNFGSLYDFTELQTLGPTNLLVSLQTQGLADSLGINDTIAAYGLDPNEPNNVPAEIITVALQEIVGSDLAKIIDQTGATLVKEPETAADLLDPSFFMPPGAVAALGLSPGAAGMSDLQNTMINLGVQGNNVTLGKFVGGMQTQATTFLNQVNVLLPQSVTTTLTPLMGTGSGLFGNPTMSDMMGTAAGATHTASFTTINNTLNSLLNSSVGQSLYTTAVALQTAIQTSTGIPAALSAFQSAVTTFNSTTQTNSDLNTTVTNANSAYTASQTQLSKEVSNLSLAGINLSSQSAPPTGPGPVLNMANKLHDFGVDKQQLGHNELFAGIATNDLTGDAIVASLQEGRNLSTSYAVGKSTPSVNNQSAMIDQAKTNASLFAGTSNSSLTYSGSDNVVWDRTNQERLRRGLPSLSTLGVSRPNDPPITPTNLTDTLAAGVPNELPATLPASPPISLPAVIPAGLPTSFG